jgi:hypothetical protein
MYGSWTSANSKQDFPPLLVFFTNKRTGGCKIRTAYHFHSAYKKLKQKCHWWATILFDLVIKNDSRSPVYVMPVTAPAWA